MGSGRDWDVEALHWEHEKLRESGGSEPEVLASPEERILLLPAQGLICVMSYNMRGFSQRFIQQGCK